MPSGDRTGPQGRGPLTGRGLGYCSSLDRPGYTTAPRYGRGLGRGRSRGFGRGFWGTGRGFFRQYYYDEPYQPANNESYPPLSKEEEKSYLQNIIKRLEEEMSQVKQRMQDINKEK